MRAGISRIGNERRAVDARRSGIPRLAHVEQQRLRAPLSASQAASSAGVICFIRTGSAPAARRWRAARSRSRTARALRSAPGAVQVTSCAAITGASPTTANSRPPGARLLEQRLRQHRHRAGEHDHVVGRLRSASRAPRRRSRASRCRCRGARACRAPSAASSGLISTRMTCAGAVREQRGHVAAAGADLEHPVGLRRARAPAPRAPRAWAAACCSPWPSGNLHVGEGERAVRRAARIPRARTT